MEVSKLQQLSYEIVAMIDRKKGIVRDTHLTISQIVEEFGELVEAINYERLGKGKFQKESVEEEFADVFILLSTLAKDFDVDFEAAVIKKIEVLKHRHNLSF